MLSKSQVAVGASKLPLPQPELFEGLNVDWDEIEAIHGRAIRQSFLDGATDAVLENLRNFLDLLPVTQQEIAEKINVDRSSVSHFLRGGGIRLQHFLLLLTEYGIEMGGLCSETERAIAGYLAAIKHIQANVFQVECPLPLTREGFLSICLLWSSPHWQQAAVQHDRLAMERAIGELHRRLRAEFGVESSRLLGLEWMQKLMVEWGPCWLVCLRLVPQRWAF